MQTIISNWRILALALIQGVTEIFPISSSGHLTIFSYLFQSHITLNVIIFFHIGTFFSIFIKYRVQAIRILSGKYGGKLLLYMALSFLTTGCVGIIVRGFADRIVIDEVNTVTFFWILNGCILVGTGLFSPLGKRNFNDLKLWEFVLVGIVQGITAIPGISRLGMTLVTGLILGLLWFDALDLSFLLSLPTILFANIFTIIQENVHKFYFITPFFMKWLSPSTEPNNMIPNNFLIAMLAMTLSFVSGLLSIQILSKYLSKKLLVFFGLYCIVAGVFFFFYLKLF